MLFSRTPLVSFASCVVIGLSLVCPGCASDDAADRRTADTTGPNLPPPEQLNKETAAEQLQMAEAAEKRGDYARAMEVYNELRSYPKPSRPDDLDARIARVEKMMKKPAK